MKNKKLKTKEDLMKWFHIVNLVMIMNNNEVKNMPSIVFNAETLISNALLEDEIKAN